MRPKEDRTEGLDLEADLKASIMRLSGPCADVAPITMGAAPVSINARLSKVPRKENIKDSGRIVISYKLGAAEA